MLHQTSYGLQNCPNHSTVMLKIIEFNYFKRTLGTIDYGSQNPTQHLFGFHN